MGLTKTMGGGTDSKKQLGKISLQQRRVNAAQRREQRDDAKESRREREAAAAGPQAVVDSSVATLAQRHEALRVLSARHGMPAIDLSEQVIPLSALRLLPLEIARERSVFAFRVEGDQLMLAMSSPADPELIDELEFVTSKKIQAFVALEEMIRSITEDAYGQLQRGEEFYVPPQAKQLPEAESAGAAPEQASPEPVLSEPAHAGIVSAWTPSERPPINTDLDEAFSYRTPPSHPPATLRLEADTSVLIAAREPATRGALKEALEQGGIAVIEAGDGGRTLECLRDAGPQLLVLETWLPAVHGLDICRRLRASPRYQALPIVMIGSSYGGWRMAHDLRASYGVEHYFDAPVNALALADTVRLLLLGEPSAQEPPPLSRPAEAHWNAAMEAFHRGDIDQAIAELEEGTEREPQTFELQYHLGLLYGRREDLFAAIARLELALQMQPRHFLASKNLAAVCQRAGLPLRALDAWQRAMSVAPDDEARVNIREHVVSLL